MEPGRTPVIDDVHRAVQSVWPTMPRQPVRSLSDYRADTLSLPRFSAVGLSGFAALTLVLAAIGLFGVTTYLTEQRTQEIGVRMALGADSVSVLWLVVRQALRPLTIGLVLGAGTAWATTGVRPQWLYGVPPSGRVALGV